jgi:hypothetical protein
MTGCLSAHLCESVGLQGNGVSGSPGSPLTVNQVPFTFSLVPK